MATKGKGIKKVRKAKKIGLRERIIRLLGGVPAPKPRKGNVAVKPYNRKKPAVKVEGAASIPAQATITQESTPFI